MFQQWPHRHSDWGLLIDLRGCLCDVVDEILVERLGARIGLEMLIEIDRICRKCDIAYEIDGGTLLGAVRSFQYPIGCLLSMMFLIPFGSLISCRT